MTPTTTDIYLQSFVCILLIAVALIGAHVIADKVKAEFIKNNPDTFTVKRKHPAYIISGQCVSPQIPRANTSSGLL
jgi:hypothetical protein